MFHLRPRRRAPMRVTLYSKPGCHLCEAARVLLEDVQYRYGLLIDEVDISSDPELFRTYDIWIPVILLADGSELKAPIQEKQLRTALKAAARRR